MLLPFFFGGGGGGGGGITRPGVHFQQYYRMEVGAMKAGRVIILIGVGIIVVMVLTVSLWVIPRAAVDTSPIVLPEGAVSCFFGRSR